MQVTYKSNHKFARRGRSNHIVLFVQENDFWVKELDLTFGDKRALERDGAMLTDKHIYAAHKLLRIQFPHLQGCHSTLLLQLKKFPSVTSVKCSGNCRN